MGTFYPQIFLEALHEASVIPLSGEPTFYAIKAFGEQPMLLPVVLAILGAALGHAFNWWVGAWLKKMRAEKNWMPSQTSYEKLSDHFQKFGIYLLLLAWLPFCNILTVGAGFLGAPFKKSLLLVVVGLAWHYGRVLIQA